MGILSVLAEVEKITVQELAERFEVSKRTIFRDLEALNCAGVPIVSYSGIGGGISIIEGYKIEKKVLTSDDAQKIFVALDGLRSIDGDSSINSLIAKLVPEREENIFAKSQYVINLSSWFNDSLIQKKISAFYEAINHRQCVSIEYISKESHTARVIEPHKLVFKQSDWYLYAFCRTRNAFRMFKLKRIASYKVLNLLFETKEIDHIDFGGNYGSDSFASSYTAGSFLVELEYDLQNEFALTDRMDASFFHRSDDPAGIGQIRFYTTSLSFAEAVVFDVLDKVRVISPPELYEAIKSRLENISNFYKR